LSANFANALTDLAESRFLAAIPPIVIDQPENGKESHSNRLPYFGYQHRRTGGEKSQRFQ